MIIVQKSNLASAQDIVFIKEMMQSAIYDTAENFCQVAVNANSSVIIWGKWGDQSLVPNIGENTCSEDNVEEFEYSLFEFVVCIFDNFI